MNVPPSSLDTPPLVGRDRELALLRQQLAAAIGGQGSLVLIGGEAGIGKSALAEALCREAEALDALVLVGRCYDLTETPPYGPWVELFRRYRRNEGMLALPAPFSRRGSLGEVVSQEALFQQVLDFFIALAGQRPLVLLLEDIHWADPASLDLLRFAARNLTDCRLLLLATYRSDEVPRDHPL
jgi:predicted ATPase